MLWRKLWFVAGVVMCTESRKYGFLSSLIVLLYLSPFLRLFFLQSLLPKMRIMCFVYRYGCEPYLIRNLAKMGFKEPTPIQRQAIPVLLSVWSSI